jgi:CRISPR-associated endonuclease/helicase Cas3
MNILAHLTKNNGVRLEQSLKEHCLHTAYYASESLKNVGFYYTAYLSGVIHDMGKGSHYFQEYLEAAFCEENVAKIKVTHTFTPVIYLLEKYHTNPMETMNLLTSEIIGYAVGAHHGLFDCTDLDGNNGYSHRLGKDRDEIAYQEACQRYFTYVVSEEKLDELFQKSVIEVHDFFEKAKKECVSREKTFFQMGFLIRLLTSAVIYGDRRDTSEFMEQKNVQGQKTADWEKELMFLNNKLSHFDKSSALNQVRCDISRQCFECAQKPAGVYRLNIPTGSGKTLSALRYALAHAENNSKKKIIFIIPLLSVLDQNVKVIREFLSDEELILEHHSNVIYEKNGEHLDEYEVLMENWDSPVIVSTMVQFLNMLFGHKTSAVGRMRALCDSVIVIDEVQSVPKKTVEMFCMAINFLSQHCNATILLSSATQPCFENLKFAIKFSEPADLVCLTDAQKQVFVRSEVINCVTPDGMDFEECTEFCIHLMNECKSLLVICNTKTEARKLFTSMQTIAKENNWIIMHLSTAMCQKHRLDILEQLQEKLSLIQKETEQSYKIICISTQLVEAGIDFSFETVVRVLAGIDNLAQAAGRCNRSNEYHHLGKVYLIRLKNENLSMLQEIYEAQRSTERILEEQKQNGQLVLNEEVVNKFYQYFFEEIKNETKYPIKEKQTTLYMTDLLANKNVYAGGKENQNYFFHQAFKTVAQRFTVFDDKTIDVIVPYQNGIQLIDKLRTISQKKGDILKGLSKDVMREIKPYTISIFQYQKKQLEEYGLLEYLFEGRILVLDKKVYQDDYGLGDISEPEVETYIY